MGKGRRGYWIGSLLIKQFSLITLCLSSIVGPFGLRAPFSTVAELPGVQGRKRGKEEKGRQVLLSFSKERNMVFSAHADRFLGYLRMGPPGGLT